MIMVFMGHFLLREITRQFISGSCYFYHSYFKSTDTRYAMKMKNNLIMPVLLFPYFLIIAKIADFVQDCNNSIANELELPQSCTKPSICMVTSSNRSIVRVTFPWCREIGGHRWISVTKANDAELWCFLWFAPEQTVEKQFSQSITVTSDGARSRLKSTSFYQLPFWN